MFDKRQSAEFLISAGFPFKSKRGAVSNLRRATVNLLASPELADGCSGWFLTASVSSSGFYLSEEIRGVNVH